jgi:hypothetical protein
LDSDAARKSTRIEVPVRPVIGPPSGGFTLVLEGSHARRNRARNDNHTSSTSISVIPETRTYQGADAHHPVVLAPRTHRSSS